ncbi:hypothetical protein F5883DRAFT_589269 [Diaporthe sp. PMI_573]|nr:hypothetical protein F5883DRAFT_589269 [Diaporthaceae sp. PMI_573]
MRHKFNGPTWVVLATRSHSFFLSTAALYLLIMALFFSSPFLWSPTAEDCFSSQSTTSSRADDSFTSISAASACLRVVVSFCTSIAFLRLIARSSVTFALVMWSMECWRLICMSASWLTAALAVSILVSSVLSHVSGLSRAVVWH